MAGVAAGALAAGGSAGAADLPMPVNPYTPGPPPMMFSWSGCSVGGHVGWGWSTTQFRDAFGGSSASMIDFSGLGRSSNVNGNGVLGGGQLGCDYQFSPWFVAGVQFSAAGAGISGTNVDPFALGSSLQSKTDFLADISVRLGFAWNNFLFYGKGGAAWANNNYNFMVSPTAALAGATNASGSDTPFGVIAGVGVEWAFAPNWSAFLEYDHYFMGTDTVTFNSAGFINLVNVRQDIDTVKVGANYHFNFWIPPSPY
jgi:outer membrane immunogenic protein